MRWAALELGALVKVERGGVDEGEECVQGRRLSSCIGATMAWWGRLWHRHKAVVPDRRVSGAGVPEGIIGRLRVAMPGWKEVRDEQDCLGVRENQDPFRSSHLKVRDRQECLSYSAALFREAWKASLPGLEVRGFHVTRAFAFPFGAKARFVSILGLEGFFVFLARYFEIIGCLLLTLCFSLGAFLLLEFRSFGNAEFSLRIH